MASRLLLTLPGPAAARGDLASLASEVAHAVNSPLQVLSLLSEEHVRGPARGDIRGELDRVQTVTEILGRFGHRGAIDPRPTAWSDVLVRPLGATAGDGQVRVEGNRIRPDAQADMDPGQVAQALTDVFQSLGALAEDEPIAVILESDPRSLTVRTTELQAQHALLESLPGRVVWSHETTRAPLPGWALAAAVCGDHGGALEVGVGAQEARIRLRIAP